ncbi:MAG TPA: CYTH domain-containing protein [Clostridia bacterium]|nr:CYTH domain-containing protein [Clostridia bacterium]
MITDNFTTNIETEIKVMITKAEYENLFAKAHNIFSQINHYYKLTDELCIRLRKINNEFFIQYKVNNNTEQLIGLKDKTEYSMNIEEADYIIIKNNPNALWVYLGKSKISDSFVIYKGSLETLRANVTLDSSMPDIEIDMNSYKNNIDYELEWEIDKSQYNKAVRILKKYGIDIRNRVTGLSKYKRLTESNAC